MSELHCWTDKGEWVTNEYGMDSDEMMDAWFHPATCMLAHGHDGPHEWTLDEDITVAFKEKETGR